MPEVIEMIANKKTTWKKNDKEQIFLCKNTDTALLVNKIRGERWKIKRPTRKVE